ncbi:MAG: J domain-containing protein [Pseudomonadota bacterium]
MANWLGKGLAVSAALVLAPPSPGALAWWCAAALAAGQAVDACAARLRRGAAGGTAPAGDTDRDRARRVLGIDADADRRAVRLAYRRQVSRCHPDRLPRTAEAAHRQAAEARMRELRDALDTLLGAKTG